MARLDLYRDGAFVRSLQLGSGSCVVGRAEDCDLHLVDPLASRRHFELRPVSEGFQLRDLQTVNGTDVNGVREYQCMLTRLSVVQVGEEILLFHPTGADEVGPESSAELPQWAQDSLGAVSPVRVPGSVSAPGDPTVDVASLIVDGDPTEQVSPSDLKKLHSRQMGRTRPHLLLRRRLETEVFPLDRRVNEMGLGRLQISLGERSSGGVKVLAEVRAEDGAFIVKAKGVFSRVRVSGRKVRSARLRPGDVLEVAGIELEFREGLERPEDLRDV